MRKGLKTLAVLSAVALLAGSVLAQRPGGFGRGNLVGLLSNSDVQKELKLTDEQIDKAKKVGQDLREKYQDDLAKLKNAKPEERGEKFRELNKKMSAEGQKSLGTILKPEQLKRLREIHLQQVGLSDAGAQEALKLTDEQKKKLLALAEETDKERREIVKNAQGNFREAMGKIDKLRKEAQGKQEKVLTEDQTKQWKTMLGKPFELKIERGKKD